MYTHQIENNLPTAKMETLTQSNRLNEYLLTALRTQQGVNFDKVETLKPGYTAVLKNNLKTLDSKYFTLNLGSLALTLEGWSVSDYIISNLFEV